MESTIRMAKDIIRKGEGLDREKLEYELDPIKDMPKTWKLKHTPIKRIQFPFMDTAPISPYIERRLAEQNLHMSERRLFHKRKDFLARKQHLQSEWDDLTSRETALKENFILFSKFLKTNLEKRERALKKFQSDAEIVQKRIEEINVLRKKYDIRKYEFQKMRSEIQKHSIYQSYLDQVVDIANGEFKDMEDIPIRMEVLLLAQERLHARQADQLSRLECSKRTMSQFMESKILQIIGLNNSMASVQSVYDEAVNRTLELDKIVVDLKTTLIKSTENLTAYQDSIGSMYHHISIMHGIMEKHKVKNVIDKLVQVNHSMKGYETIYDMLRRRSKRGSKLNKQSSVSVSIKK